MKIVFASLVYFLLLGSTSGASILSRVLKPVLEAVGKQVLQYKVRDMKETSRIAHVIGDDIQLEKAEKAPKNLRGLAEEETVESIAAELYKTTEEGLDVMLDIMNNATEIETVQNDGDEPNQEFLDLLEVSEAKINAYETYLAEGLDRIAALELDPEERDQVEALRNQTGPLFDAIFEDLLAVKKAEKVVNAGSNDLKEIRRLHDNVAPTYAALLKVLASLAKIAGDEAGSRSRRLEELAGKQEGWLI